ncbi:hypothetical protein PENCOP_c012G03658, partial [Penicillium coprophilum]
MPSELPGGDRGDFEPRNVGLSFIREGGRAYAKMNTLVYLSLTLFALVASSHSSLINRSPSVLEIEDGLPATVRVGVTLWLGDGESCTAETVTHTSTQTGNISPGATTITIVEATTKTSSGCQNPPTLDVLANGGIGLGAATASAAIVLRDYDYTETITDYTTETITS